MVKILHCADLHIDTLFSSCTPKEAKARRAQLLSAFSKAVERARMEKTQLFLIAGDMFDDAGAVSFETLSYVTREIASLPDCRFVISCGNHDPYTQGGIFDSVLWPENAFIFKSDRVERFSFDDINTDVYGYSFTSRAMRECPLENFAPADKTKINIVLAHGDTEDPLSNYCPIRKKLLDALDVDYIALGHIHKGGESYDGGKYSYSGCISGRALDESGEKGFLCGEVSRGRRKLKFISPDPVLFEIKQLDASDFATGEELCAAMERAVSEYSEKTEIRLVLKGELSELIETIPKPQTQLAKLEIIDDTVPRLNLGSIKSEMSLKGAVYERLKPHLESDDEDERKKGKLALKYIMSALKGENIFD